MRSNNRKRSEVPGTPERRESPNSLTQDEDVADSASKPPPSKKRKVGDSPPWKSAITQTPTSFIENGRRKSGRTNPIPPELLPPPPNGITTRQTRSSAQQNNPKTTVTNQAARVSASGSSVKRQTNGKNGHLITYSKKTAVQPRGSPHKESLVNKATATHKTPTKQPSTKPPSSSKNGQKSMPRKASPLPPPPSVSSSRRSTRAANRIATETAVIQKSSKNEAQMSPEEETELGADWKPPKIKLRFRRTPPLTIAHPLHVPPKPKFKNFEEFLQSESTWTTAAEVEAAEDLAKREAEIRRRVEDAYRGGVLAPDRCSVLMPPEQPSPPRQYSHHDCLLAHALHFQKLMDRERKLHMAMARKIAIACAQKVQEAIPKTKEELEEEEFLENQRFYREVIITGLRNKWAMVTEEIERRRRERAEELHRIAGKDALNQMIEHSTQLLKVRTARHTSVATTSEVGEDADANGDEEASSEEGEDVSDESGEDEVNMSSSDVDDEQDDNADDDDANLTVEELRVKYAALSASRDVEEVTKPTGRNTPARDTPNGINAPSIDGEVSIETERRFNGVHEATLSLSSPSPALPPLEEVDDVLLDDDESVIMDSELDTDGADSGSETDDGNGLLGLMEDVEMLNKSNPEALVPADNDEECDPSYHGETGLCNGTSQALKINGDHARDEDVTSGERTACQTTGSSGHSSTINGYKEIDIDTTPTNSPGQVNVESAPASQRQNAAIKTPVPFLLRGKLREYQHFGLDWLAGLYENKTNGILADEMGLGKTIQTIALIAYLACEKEIWGPHLIVVPTSVMLNWEMEFKKWAPGFKILTYYGSREQRAEKRKGWNDDNMWHVCITSYQLVLQDQVTFKRRNWHYLILDEAHNIKNFRSQRWQTLLNFKAEARLLLTGTPLQNNLVELWSLLYFLMPSGVSSMMPSGFANLQEFQEWFARPVDQLIEGGREIMDEEAKNTVTKLHRILRPYLLRRLKADVEKQMPAKYEHIVYCRLSKRQRYLYDDFMSLAKTRETLASGNYLSIINCLMQLRKVCNHPDLFETRQIVTSFAVNKSAIADYEIKELLVRRKMLQQDPMEGLDFSLLNLTPAHDRQSTTIASRLSQLSSSNHMKQLYDIEAALVNPQMAPNFLTVTGAMAYKQNAEKASRLGKLKHCLYLNNFRCSRRPIYGTNLLEKCQEGIIIDPMSTTRLVPRNQISKVLLNSSNYLREMVLSLEKRSEQLGPAIEKFGCVTPNAVCTDMPSIALTPLGVEAVQKAQAEFASDPFHQTRVRLSIAFPDKRLLQYDCGKLQRLDLLLRELKAGGHRALIFTQMTKVLDILEQFLNIHGYRYLRLDGSTKIEQRQILTERFNNDPRILVFILSTRSGGLGINLTGADTVIFYDLDWNPAMDKQCQDRCHRIGQTRDVHIYRFVSEYTIESNILRKANQKRMLDRVVIQEGDFTTDYFNKLTLEDMLGEDVLKDIKGAAATNIALVSNGHEMEKALELAEDVEDAAAAKAAQKEVVESDVADFDERPTPKDTTAVNTPKDVSSFVSVTSLSTPRDLPGIADDNVSLAINDGQVEQDAQGGHIDDWMLVHIEWELRDVPLILPEKNTGKSKKRSKKAKPYA